MDDWAHLRTVPPKDLNGRCAAALPFHSVEIRVDATHARARSKIEDSKSTIMTARVAPFKIKPSKGMHIEGLARHAWRVGGG